jgi:hypothetical protein
MATKQGDSFMDKFGMAVGAMVVSLGIAFFFIIAASFMGGVAGWCVGLVFGDTILGIAGQFGLHGVTMFQLGVFLGFVGGFLKTKVSAEVKGAK